jgi:hypothetical protein
MGLKRFTGKKYPPPRKVKKLLNIMGFEVWGNIGSLTVWRTPRGSLVVAERYPRFDPRSPAQLNQRRRFKQAHDEFQSLTQEQKALWEEATKRLGIPMTGKNFYLHVRLTGLWIDYELACDALGFELPLPSNVKVGDWLE